MTDLLGGQVQLYFGTTASSIEYVRTGKLRPLGVTSATRAAVLPDVPALAEFLPGYEASQWIGIGAPKNTPAAIVNKLNAEINAALADPAMKAKMTALGGMVLPGTASEFGKFVADETVKWAKVVKFSGARAN